MPVPFFYISDYTGNPGEITLEEDTSAHVVQVLRMNNGERINLTDGNGHLLQATIISAHKKHCLVKVDHSENVKRPARTISIAISLVKNNARFEWFLEKATEIGINKIIPLICERTEKEKFRFDRMKQICISAMLQSQQVWLPGLSEPVSFGKIKEWQNNEGPNFIAHCEKEEKQPLSNFLVSHPQHSLICIGPEGDFTPAEIETAINNGFIPVSLGNNRLRTETAALVAAVLMAN
jgi:16S rRNA (uracil1498-N3)-methyltransferase